MVSAGWMLTVGQPMMRTVPPLTTAAARNGTALDRSGSMTQRLASTRPGATRHRPAAESSTSTPASRSIDTVIAMCGADGTAPPVCTTVRPSVNAAPDSSRPDTNCEDPDASISTVPPRTDPVPRTANGRPSPSTCTPSPRSPSSSGAIGRDRACSSPSNVTVSVVSAATGGRKRSTVPARPQSMRAPACGASAPPTVSSHRSPSSDSTDTPRSRSAAIIRSVSRLRSAPLIVELPCGTASAARTSARLVCDFEPGTVTVAWMGVAVDGACQVLTGSLFPVADPARPSTLNVALRAGFPGSGTMETCADVSR